MIRIHLTILVVFFSICLYAQEKAYMTTFETANMKPHYQISTTRIMKSYINQAGKYDVLLGTMAADSVVKGESMQEVQRKAQELSVPYFIIGALDRLGEVVVVSVALYNTADGTKVWEGVGNAKSPEELDPVLQTLATSIGNSKKGNNNSIVKSAVEDYHDRIRSKTFIGLGLGGALIHYPYPSDALPAGGALYFLHDNGDFIADFVGEFYVVTKAAYLFNINTYYPFKKDKNTAYIGGGIGVGGISVTTTTNSNFGTYTSNRSNGGLMLVPGGGYIFNRNSNVRIKTGAKLLIPFFSIQGVVPVSLIGTVNIEFGL